MSSVQFLFPDSEAVRALQPDRALSAKDVWFLTQGLPERFRVEQREMLSCTDRFWAFLGQRNWRTVRVETKEGTKLVYFDVRKVIDQIGNVFFKAYPCTSEKTRKNISDFNVDELKRYVKQWELEEEILTEEIRRRVRGGVPPLCPETVEYLTKNFSLQMVETPSFFQRIRGRWVPIKTAEGSVFLNVKWVPLQRDRFSDEIGYITINQNTEALRSYFIESVCAMRPWKYTKKWYTEIAEDAAGLKPSSPSKVANQ